MNRPFFATVAAFFALSCGGGDFDPQNVVSGVRVLSSAVDKPFAKPGDKVTVDLLVADGRPDKTVPLTVSWIPFVCQNPVADQYYGCFSQLLSPGTDGSPGLSQVPLGVDISPYLPKGTSYQVTIPTDIVKPREGQATPYGLVMLFNVACAGRLVLTTPDPSAGAAALPFQCVDAAGNQVSADNYVIGYTRIFVYDQKTNSNPVIDGLTYDGTKVDLTAGITADRCTLAKQEDCPKHTLTVDVPATSQEVNEGQVDAYGNVLKEIVWSAFYSDAGRFDEDVRLLYDARTGKVASSEAHFRPGARSGSIWVVAKDNRGGTSWKQIPVTVR